MDKIFKLKPEVFSTYTLDKVYSNNAQDNYNTFGTFKLIHSKSEKFIYCKDFITLKTMGNKHLIKTSDDIFVLVNDNDYMDIMTLITGKKV